MYKFNFLILLFLIDFPILAITLFQNGTPSAKIVTADRPTRSTRLAISELNHYFYKMTGHQLPVIQEKNLTGKEKNLIFVGASKSTERLGFSNRDFAKQEYMIRSYEDKLIIMGADDEDYGTIDFSGIGSYRYNGLWDSFGYFGWRDKKIGTVYAADDFLRACGIRWYMPTEIGEVVPRHKTIAFKKNALNIRRKPDMDMRASGYFSFPMCFYIPSDKNVFTVDKISNRDKALFAMRHKEWGNGNICNHAFNDWKNLYKNTHPEYAALQKNGSRNFNQLCYHSPEVQKQITEDWKKLLKTNKNKTVDVSISPNDYNCWCQCDKCIKYFQGLTRKKHFSNDYASNYIWSYAADMAEQAKKIDARIQLMCLAYWDYYGFPSLKNFRLPDNITVALCRTNLRRYGKLYSRNGYTRENIQKWADALSPGKLTFWEYFNFPQYRQGNLFPSVLPHRIAEDFKWKKKLNSGGIFLYFADSGTQCYSHVAMEHIDHYIARRFLDDSSLNIDVVMDEYYKLFYGPAAVPMKKFWERIEEICEIGCGEKGSSDIGANQLDYPELIWTSMSSPGKAKELRQYMDQALALATTEPYLQRVKMMNHSTCKFIERLTKAYARHIEDVAMACLLTKKAPDINNEDDRVWDSAFTFRRFLDQTRTINESDIKSKLLYDQNNIYLKVQVTQDSSPIAKATKRDGAVWLDDGIEFFLKAEKSPVRQYVINTQGVLLDSRERNIKWNGNARTKVTKTDSGWIYILQIPIRELFDTEEISLENFKCCIIVNQPSLSTSWYSCKLSSNNFDIKKYAKLLFMQ